MRNILRAVLVVLCLLMPAVASAAVAGFARISMVQGEVQVRADEDDEWLPAGVNSPLEEGDSVWAPAGSRVEIQFRNGTILRLEGRTIVDLVDMEIDQQRVHVTSGRLYVKTGYRADDLQVDWGGASVLVERKSRLKVDLLANGDEEVAIIKGAASVESAGERTRVRAGEIITLHDYRGTDIAPLRPVDEWERWNAKRDKQLAARKRTDNYLPEELVVYEDELAKNGDWVVVEEYGYVWRPRVSVSADWAPYREGRWVWRGGDYVWITSEPWGWAPYHYGRWASLPGRGWCWVPPARGDVFWGPGYVGWVSTGSQVGWVPLAPRETYYGHGHYGRHSVNIPRGDVRTVNVTYRNVTINNSVTVVNRDGFIRGTGRHEAARNNVFRNTTQFVSRPEARPTAREARMPIVKPIVSRHQAPQVQRPPARELRERYPLLRQERQQVKDSAPPRREGRPVAPALTNHQDQRGAAVTSPAPAVVPPPAQPRRGGGESRQERPPTVIPQEAQTSQSAQPKVAPAVPRTETRMQEPKPVETRVKPAVESVKEEVKPQNVGRGRERSSEGRRSWRVETKEKEPSAAKGKEERKQESRQVRQPEKQESKQAAPAEAKEPKPERASERRRRD